MQLKWRRRLALLAACGCLAVAWAAGSDAAIVRHDGLELRAEGEFTPHELPRHRPAPIVFEGRASVRSTVGGPAPRLEQLILEFDRDGRLSTKGLATCPPARVEHLGTIAARRRCKEAIVGEGEVGAIVLIEGRWLPVTGELTLFNGPRVGGNATVVAHAQPASIPGEIYVVTIPIERTRGEFAYRATIEVPEVFNGAGVLTRVKAKIGRRYRAGGRERSYVSAKCTDGILRVHGILTFAEGTVIDGTIEKYCVPAGLFGP